MIAEDYRQKMEQVEMEIIVKTENHEKELMIVKSELENQYFKMLTKQKHIHETEINEK